MRAELRRNEAPWTASLPAPFDSGAPASDGPLHNLLYTTTNEAHLHPPTACLLVTRLDGPTPPLRAASWTKALEAETNGLWGRAYFDLRNTPKLASKSAMNGFATPPKFAATSASRPSLTKTPDFPAGFPMSQIAIYIGWYTEHVSGPLAQPTVEFMPGAFAYHLHSFSAGSLRTTNRNWVGPLLAKGARSRWVASMNRISAAHPMSRPSPRASSSAAFPLRSRLCLPKRFILAKPRSSATRSIVPSRRIPSNFTKNSFNATANTPSGPICVGSISTSPTAGQLPGRSPSSNSFPTRRPARSSPKNSAIYTPLKANPPPPSTLMPRPPTRPIPPTTPPPTAYPRRKTRRPRPRTRSLRRLSQPPRPIP